MYTIMGNRNVKPRDTGPISIVSGHHKIHHESYFGTLSNVKKVI